MLLRGSSLEAAGGPLHLRLLSKCFQIHGGFPDVTLFDLTLAAIIYWSPLIILGWSLKEGLIVPERAVAYLEGAEVWNWDVKWYLWMPAQRADGCWLCLCFPVTRVSRLFSDAKRLLLYSQQDTSIRDVQKVLGKLRKLGNSSGAGNGTVKRVSALF